MYPESVRPILCGREYDQRYSFSPRRIVDFLRYHLLLGFVSVTFKWCWARPVSGGVNRFCVTRKYSRPLFCIVFPNKETFLNRLKVCLHSNVLIHVLETNIQTFNFFTRFRSSRCCSFLLTFSSFAIWIYLHVVALWLELISDCPDVLLYGRLSESAFGKAITPREITIIFVIWPGLIETWVTNRKK